MKHMYIVYSPVYSSVHPMYIVYSLLQIQCTVQFTLCTVQCTVQCTSNAYVYYIQPSLQQCTSSVRCAQFSVHAGVQSNVQCTVQYTLQCTSAVQFKCSLDNLVCRSSAHLGHMWAHLVYSQVHTQCTVQEHSPVYIPVFAPYPGQCTVYRTLYSPVCTSVHLVCSLAYSALYMPLYDQYTVQCIVYSTVYVQCTSNAQ